MLGTFFSEYELKHQPPNRAPPIVNSPRRPSAVVIVVHYQAGTTLADTEIRSKALLIRSNADTRTSIQGD